MTPQVREAVRERARDRCEYCRTPAWVSVLPFEIDHIVARQHGGGADPENLALACPICNQHKGPNLSSIDPQTQLHVRLFNPRLDNWDDHFLQIGGFVEGRTPTGRATVDLLEFNCQAQRSMRQLIDRIENE